MREREILKTIEVGDIDRIEFRRINGIAKRIIYLYDGTFMVTKQREDEINAISKI